MIIGVDYTKLQKLLKEKNISQYSLVDKPRRKHSLNYDPNIYRFNNTTFEIINGKRDGDISIYTLIKFMNLLHIVDINKIITLIIK